MLGDLGRGTCCKRVRDGFPRGKLNSEQIVVVVSFKTLDKEADAACSC